MVRRGAWGSCGPKGVSGTLWVYTQMNVLVRFLIEHEAAKVE